MKSARGDKFRGVVLILWIVGFAINIGMVAYAQQSIFKLFGDEPPEYRDGINQLLHSMLRAYAPYLVVMLAFFFSKTTSHRLTTNSHLCFLIVIAISFAWNAYLCYNVTQVALLKSSTVQQLASELNPAYEDWTPLVLPTITYYFGFTQST